MAGYRPAIAPAVADRIRHLPPDVKRSVKEAIRAVAKDSALGEPLERELSGYRKYRVRRYRVVYRADRDAKTVNIVAVGRRSTVYEEAAARIRGQG